MFFKANNNNNNNNTKSIQNEIKSAKTIERVDILFLETHMFIVHLYVTSSNIYRHAACATHSPAMVIGIIYGGEWYGRHAIRQQ